MSAITATHAAARQIATTATVTQLALALAVKLLTPGRRTGQRLLITAKNHGRTTARAFLLDQGYDVLFVTKYEGPFGKTAAGLFRETFTAEPATGAVLVRGKVRDAKVYTRRQAAAVLVPALTAYPRTAELMDEAAARRTASALIGA